MSNTFGRNFLGVTAGRTRNITSLCHEAPVALVFSIALALSSLPVTAGFFIQAGEVVVNVGINRIVGKRFVRGRAFSAVTELTNDPGRHADDITSCVVS